MMCLKPLILEVRDRRNKIFVLKVDLVTKNGLKTQIRDRVLAEEI